MKDGEKGGYMRGYGREKERERGGGRGKVREMMSYVLICSVYEKEG